MRLVADNGVDPAVVVATLALPTPANGDWSTVTLDTGPIAAVYAGYNLFIEVQQDAAGGGNQILVDNVNSPVSSRQSIPTRLVSTGVRMMRLHCGRLRSTAASMAPHRRRPRMARRSPMR